MGIVRDIVSTHHGMRHRIASEILVYTASGKSPLPDGTKPLPEPLLTCHGGIFTTSLQGELTPYSPGGVISIVNDQGHNSRFSLNWHHNYVRTSRPFTTGPVRCQLSCRPMNVQAMNKRCVAKCRNTMMLQSTYKNINIKKYGQTNL